MKVSTRAIRMINNNLCEKLGSYNFTNEPEKMMYIPLSDFKPYFNSDRIGVKTVIEICDYYKHIKYGAIPLFCHEFINNLATEKMAISARHRGRAEKAKLQSFKLMMNLQT